MPLWMLILLGVYLAGVAVSAAFYLSWVGSVWLSLSVAWYWPVDLADGLLGD